MPDERHWSPHVASPAHKGYPVETLWTLQKDSRSRRADLRDFGDHGVELQWFRQGGEFLNGQHYRNRELALAAADQFRDTLLSNGWTCARCGGEFWIYAPNETGRPCPDCNGGDPPRPPKDFVSDVRREP